MSGGAGDGCDERGEDEEGDELFIRLDEMEDTIDDIGQAAEAGEGVDWEEIDILHDIQVGTVDELEHAIDICEGEGCTPLKFQV